jgi:ribonuclease D
LLEDAAAMSLVQQVPRTAAELDNRTRGQRALRSPQRAELLAVLLNPVDADEIAATQSIPESPQGEAKRALPAMKDCVDKLAGELDLPAGLLCPRKVLEEYVVTAQWPEFLEGWRRQILFEPLSRLLP